MSKTIVFPQDLHLAKGAHPDRESGACLMEAVAWFAGEKHSDSPKCVSPYLRSFGITLNDRASDEQRQDLLPFVPLVVGTAGDGLDETRRWLAADHVTHVTVPMWLDLAGLTDRATTLRGLPPITNRDEWQAARPVIRLARDAAWELRSGRWAKIRADVTAAVTKALADQPVAVAVAADAVAVAAVAAAVAAADAVAVAVAVAAAADADAVAVAVAVAAAADAAAVADAVAAARYSDRYWVIRRVVYDAVYAKMRAAYGERFATVTASAWPDAVALYGRLINPVSA